MDDLDKRLRDAGIDVLMHFDGGQIDHRQLADIFGSRLKQAANDLFRLALNTPSLSQVSTSDRSADAA